MAKQKTKLLIVSSVLIMLIALVPLLAACAKEAPPPAEKATVGIGFAIAFTGPIAAIVAMVEPGFSDYVRYANEEELIPGVILEPIIEDTRYTPEGAAAAYRRARARGALMIFVPTGTDNAYIDPFARDDDYMMFSASPSAETLMPTRGATYGPSATEGSISVAYVDWVCQNWDYQAKGRPPRIAYISMDNPMGHAPEDATAYVKKHYDVEHGPFLYTGMAPPTDFTAELIRIAAAGTDYLVIQQGAGGTITCMKDIVRLGLREQIEPGLAICNCVLLITQRVPELCDGITGNQPYAYLGGPEPGCIKAREIQARYHPEEISVDYLYALAWAPMIPIVEMYKRAVENVGAENLDNKALRDALLTIDNFDTGGLLPLLSWVEEDARIGCYEISCWHFGSDGLPASITWHKVPHEYEAYGFKP